ncbi:hypothetical protein BDZ89DRAFT_1070719, partial [Hymenopellis radicata]
VARHGRRELYGSWVLSEMVNFVLEDTAYPYRSIYDQQQMLSKSRPYQPEPKVQHRWQIRLPF